MASPPKTWSAPTASAAVPRPNPQATIVLLVCLAITGLTDPPAGTPSSHARFAAIGVGLSLILFLFVEFRKSWANLLRADLVAVVALYFFLFLEFLFPQRRLYEFTQDVDEIEAGITVCLWAFAAMAVGRHFLPRAWSRHWRVTSVQVRPATMVWMFVWCFILGFFHMLYAVD